MNNLRRRVLLSSSGGTGREMIGNYEVVDLGLPSGLLWATCNVGASKETGYGDYYQWGAGSTKYAANTNQSHSGGTDSSYVLPPNTDTATQVMGNEWRMPTYADCLELLNNTIYTWKTNFNNTGINGSKFTSKTNPNAYIFIPAAGYYDEYSQLVCNTQRSRIWSSTPQDQNYSYFMEYNGLRISWRPWHEGKSVRAVLKDGRVTLSSYEYSAAPGSSTQYIYAYCDNYVITNFSNVMISNTNSSLMSFSTNSSGMITIYINSQYGNTSQRSGSLILTYNGKQVTYTVTQAADYVASETSTHSITGVDPVPTSSSIPLTVTSSTKCTNANTFTVSYEQLDSTVNTKTYASGYKTSNVVETTVSEKTQTFGAGSIEIDYTQKVDGYSANNYAVCKITQFNNATSCALYGPQSEGYMAFFKSFGTVIVHYYLWAKVFWSGNNVSYFKFEEEEAGEEV